MQQLMQLFLMTFQHTFFKHKFIRLVNDTPANVIHNIDDTVTCLQIVSEL